MTLWTRQELIEQIACWKAAYKAASTGKSYTIDGRTLTRYELPQIREQLTYLEREWAALPESGRRRGPVAVTAIVRR